VVTAVSESIGGPLGRFAYGRRAWFTAAGVLALLAALTTAVGMLQKAPCYATNWSGGDQRYTQMCYSDLPPLYVGRGFAEAAWPYADDPTTRSRYEVMEYPVGISYWAWVAAKVTHLSTSPDLDERAGVPVDKVGAQEGVGFEMRVFVIVNAIGFALLAILSAWLLAGVNRGPRGERRPWDAAAFALSPALALTGLINWDLLAVAFVAGALWAWARDWPLLTGVMIGLGTAAKLYPLFLLGGLLIICWRRRQWGAYAVATAAAAGSWALAQLPAWLSGLEEWRVFWTFNSERGADLGSIWLAISQVTDVHVDAHTINLVSWLFFGGWCLAVLALGLYADRTPTLAQLGFLVVAGFLLINKVYSPQYVLWLLPLAVLAVPRWRDQLIWQAGEVLYFACVWWYLAGELDSGSGDAPFYWVAIGLRMLAELYLVVVVVRDILQGRSGSPPVCGGARAPKDSGQRVPT